MTYLDFIKYWTATVGAIGLTGFIAGLLYVMYIAVRG